MLKSVSLGLIIVLSLLAGYYLFRSKSQTPSSTQSISEVTSTPQSTSSGNYLIHTPSVLDSSETNRRVLFFYANWCPTCRPADADFQANSSKLPKDVTLIRVNYNDPDTDQSEKDLAKKYTVTYQHTFVQIDVTGAVITKWNGGGLSDLLGNIKP